MPINVIDDFFKSLQSLIRFLKDYAKKNPEFRKALEVAISEHPALKEVLKVSSPHEYVGEYGLPGFAEHLKTADETLVREYAKRLKLKLPKSTSLDDVRGKVLATMEQQLNKGKVFAEQET